MNISYLDNQIILTSSKTFAFIFGAIGLIMIGCAFLFKSQFVGNLLYIKHIFFAMGGMFTITALLFIVYLKNTKIDIDKLDGKIKFTEVNLGQQSRVDYAFSDYKRIIVFQKINTTSSGGKQTQSVKYEINLLRNDYFPDKLCEFQSFDKALDFVRSFTKITNIPVEIYLSPHNEIIFTPNQTDKNMVVKYESPVNIWRNAQTDSVEVKPFNNIILSANSRLKMSESSGTTTFTWNIRYSLLVSVLLTGIGLCFFFLLYKVALPGGMSIGLGIGFTIVILFTLIAVFLGLFAIAGKPQLTLSEKTVCYETFIFGKRTSKQELNYDDIKLIFNSINSANDNSITLFTDDGIKTMFSFYDSKALSASELISMVFQFKSQVMTIDTRPLSYPDRVFIEQKIRRKLRIEN